MTNEKRKRLLGRGVTRPRRPHRLDGLRIRDAKTGELMRITVEDGQLSVAPYRKAEPK